MKPIRERQEGRRAETRPRAGPEILGTRPQARGAGRGAGRGRAPGSPHWHSAPRRRVRARAVPSPRRRAGTVAHCSPGHPGRRSALGAWRGPAAICMRSSHKGSRSGAPGGPAPPGPGAILRRGGGNSSAPAPAPGPPLRVNGRAPPPSEALCVSARPAGSARDVPARAGGAPAPAPLAHANQSGSASGRAAPPGAPHVPCQEPLSFPLLLRGPEAAARPLPAPRSPARCCPAHSTSTSPRPSCQEASVPVRKSGPQWGVAGQGAKT